MKTDAVQEPQYLRMRSDWVQTLTPQPKRHLQRLILKHKLKTGLDIGCGVASPLTALRAHGFHSTGVDIAQEQIDLARGANAHDEYLKGDFRTMDFGRKFDVVVLNHVLEHFDRDEGLRVLSRIESLSARIVYVETPNGFLEQTAFDGNPFQRHLSGWFPHDFESRGYTVFGSGLKALRSSGSRPPPIPDAVVRQLFRAVQICVFRRPTLGSAIAGIRFIDPAGDVREL